MIAANLFVESRDDGHDVAELQDVALLQLALHLADANAVEKCAVGAAQVADHPALFRMLDLRVAAAD
jgi:hypothetical protein